MCEYQKKKYHRNIKGEDEKEPEDPSAAANEMSESRMSNFGTAAKPSEKTDGCPFRLVYKCKVNEHK